MPDVQLSESLEALSRFVLGQNTVAETLTKVSELTLEAVAPADIAGITMIVDGRPQTAVFTDPTSPAVDQTQYDTGDGPCLDAFREQQVHRIDSTSESGRWPAFRRAAADHGIGSTLSLPLVVSNDGLGAMNLYSKQIRGFGDEETAIASVFAAQASIVMANVQTYWDARTLSENLGEAIRTRAVIEQAKGVLMGAQHCDDEQAFQLLVRASQRENVKLRDIAKRIVESAASPGGWRPGR